MKLIIIGAPRSGTNMLRDILTSLDGVSTWPCDEINYIWRHGNVRYPSDEIPASLATPKVKEYIRGKFNEIANRYGADIVVEKTCANSLRVPFVDAVLPDAKYIFIYRDGLDATGSARERWTARLDLPYILAKVRYVPKSDLPYYAFRYCWARLYRLISRERRLPFWGPVPEGIQGYNLNELCALQWKRCVDKAEDAFCAMAEGRVLRVRYEDFVCHPVHELNRILAFMGKNLPTEYIYSLVKDVSPRSIGKGREALGRREVANLERLVGDTLKRHDYF